MGKKKKALLRYKRLGTISKKLEKKFSNFLQANINTFTLKVEETLEKVDILLDKTEEIISETKEEPPQPDSVNIPTIESGTTEVEEPVAEDKPKTTRKTTPAKKKTTSTTRKRRTAKTKTDA